MRRTALKGHALRSEGKPYKFGGEEQERWVRVERSWSGVALCECGATSPVLDSNGARQRWHRVHKEHARCADGSARAEAVLGGGVYPCTGSHDDGSHHFTAARPDPCQAPWCKLPAGHRSLHDIPSGKPEYRIREVSRD
jgi:hypothetical protein